MLFFSEANYRGNHAGTKARNDAEAILREYGAHPINTRVLELTDNNAGIQSNIANRLGYLRYYWELLFVRKQTVVIQYPMLAFDIQLNYIQKLSRHNKVIFLVHDIQSLRREGYAGLEKEIEMLNHAYGLIVHNRFMEDKLKQIGIRVQRYYRLNCFDYLFQGEVSDVVRHPGVVFAGNLEKSEFLPEMCRQNQNVTFIFYGPGWDAERQVSNVAYCGSFSPDEIPGKLQGEYGLIWDGKTTSYCTGAVGEYTRINNPHKMSLYIAAGIPVIAWNQAAIAEFIQKNQIGITVDQVDDLQSSFDKITPEQYRQMKDNVLKIRNDLIAGGYLRTVLSKIEEDLL